MLQKYSFLNAVSNKFQATSTTIIIKTAVRRYSCPRLAIRCATMSTVFYVVKIIFIPTKFFLSFININSIWRTVLWSVISFISLLSVIDII